MASDTRTGDVAIFDRIARLYDLKPATRRKKLAPALAMADRDVERVLDVGGGTGQGVRALNVPTGVVVDAAPGMLAEARDHGVAGVRGDASRLPVGDESVDAVLILDALHHMATPRAVLGEAARVLRPGGVLVCLEFDPTTVLGRGLVTAEHAFGFDSQFFTAGDLAAMVRAVGLSASIPRTGFEYTVVGVKRF
ncbi:class I SAM-dependent methyltransferase [Halorientalis pallida]|uniref:Methyltransferase domain-containing protein n=1 Tax=Halorientalis pallida TaxID=2479928 RepID=A0A498KVH1_9EURY|nr:methyltransferase domain-containing protein [Halorientalis pallida]RXK49268.1 methyltransferase domain-containing protein [Halorientalis pallida]